MSKPSVVDTEHGSRCTCERCMALLRPQYVPRTDVTGADGHDPSCTCQTCFSERLYAVQVAMWREMQEERVLMARQRFLDHAAQCERCDAGVLFQLPQQLCAGGKGLMKGWHDERSRRN